MKPGTYPKGLRVVAAAIVFVAIACVVWQLPRFKERMDKRHVAALPANAEEVAKAHPVQFQTIEVKNLQCLTNEL